MLSNSIVWTIAGSDCTGGAGIQADCKTSHNLGSETCSAITAVTAQNASGVIEINSVSNDVLLSQLNALEQDKPAQVIKIGLLTNVDQVKIVSRELSRYKQEWDLAPKVIYDPVAVASSGGNLTEEDILEAVKTHLLPLVDVLTPNNKELQQLTGVYVFSWDCMERAAQEALNLGVSSVIIKGGHIDINENYCVDYATDGYHHYWLASKTLQTEHSHGTGCTLASAVASLLAQGYLLRDAFTIAKAYINQGLEAARNYEGPYGPIWQGPWPALEKYYPEVLVPGSKLANRLDWQPGISTQAMNASGHRAFASDFAEIFEQNQENKLGLYPVVDSVEWLEKLLSLGIKTIQYREKHLQGDELESAIIAAITIGRTYQARLFINDYWQLAIKHQAYGVHLGQEDLAEADLVAIKNSGIKLGVSTHGHYEMLKVKLYRPSYLAVGAIFPTRTKDMTGQIQGLKTLNDLVKLNPDIPMVAIGGITIDKANSVANTGVGSIAVVTAITEADDYEDAVKQLQHIIEPKQ